MSRPASQSPSVLRQRAGHLRELAASIERATVMSLGATPSRPRWAGPRAELCERLLERNLIQLHEAAEGLREAAFRLGRRADELDPPKRDAA